MLTKSDIMTLAEFDFPKLYKSRFLIQYQYAFQKKKKQPFFHYPIFQTLNRTRIQLNNDIVLHLYHLVHTFLYCVNSLAFWQSS